MIYLYLYISLYIQIKNVQSIHIKDMDGGVSVELIEGGPAYISLRPVIQSDSLSPLPIGLREQQRDPKRAPSARAPICPYSSAKGATCSGTDCSKDCQAAHWKSSHKVECNAFRTHVDNMTAGP